MTRILIIEDEPGIALGLEEDLTYDGYHVEVACDGELGLKRGREGEFDLILLDVMLPKKDGFQVCRELRRAGVNTPVILLTAKSQEAEKVLGLRLGADDYVTKPFGSLELGARIQALLRRSNRGPAPAAEQFSFGDVSVDFARREVRRGGTVVDFTPLEFRLLNAFIEARGRVLSREQITSKTWDREFMSDRVVDTHIANLRKKIEADPSDPRFIISVRGVGYRFDG